MKKLYYIDCVWCRCKNLQKINTIEIFFYVNTKDQFVIEYSFHPTDIEIWREIVSIHRDQNPEAILYNEYEIEVNENNVMPTSYCIFKLKSTSFNLYRNIGLIFYLEDENEKNNMLEMMKKNTWN